MMKKYLLSIVIALPSLMLSAQELDLKQSWFMNEQLLDLIESYERHSSFEGRSDSSSFLDLFVSPEAKVWCDYLSSEYFGRYVDARTYVNLSKDFAYNSASVSNLIKRDLEYVHDAWRIRVEFDKRVNYKDALGYTFSTQSKIAGGDYHFALDCVWVPEISAFRIEKVLGYGKSAESVPDGQFIVVKKQNGIDSKLLYNGMPLDYNEYGFAILPGNGEFSLNDDDYRLKSSVTPGSGRYDVYSFSQRPKILRVRPRASVLINPLMVEMHESINAKPFSFGLEGAVDIGAALNLFGSFKYVPYLGVGLSHSWFGIKDSFMTGEKYVHYSYNERSYEFNASETFAVEDLTISISPVSFEFGLNNSLVAAVELGAKVYLNYASSDNYRLRIGVPADKNLQPGYLEPVAIPVGTDASFPHYCVTAAFLKGGADYSIMDGGLVFLHVGVESGFQRKIYSNPEPGLWYDEASGIYPVIYMMNEEGPEDHMVRTFKNSIRTVRRGLAGIVEFGFKYKF